MLKLVYILHTTLKELDAYSAGVLELDIVHLLAEPANARLLRSMLSHRKESEKYCSTHLSKLDPRLSIS